VSVRIRLGALNLSVASIIVAGMHDAKFRAHAVGELTRGASLRSVSVAAGASRSTLRSWLACPDPRMRPSGCPSCSDASFPPLPEYLYLLGMYLGDGCISHAPRTTALRIACDDHWPAVMAECYQAVGVVSKRPVYRVAGIGCTYVTTLWKHWPCLFPQHGPGVKHCDRSSWLTATRARNCGPAAVDPWPAALGRLPDCEHRASATTTGTRTYTYPRYFFSNEGSDIRGIFSAALDLLDIAWRHNRHNSISVARRDAVAALDEFVGPKA
jgi:hypothetical protein